MAIASLSGNTLSTGDGLIIRGGASGSDVAIIGTCKSENFGFITNDTLRATFDSSGNLGIGTNEPSAVLDVRGAISTNTSIASPIVSGTTCIASPVICMTGTFSLPSSDGSSGQVMCTDGSGGLTWGQGGHVIALGGTAQTQRKCLNFAGLAVCASDNSSGNATNICVKSTGVCLPVIQDDGTQIYTCFTSAVIGDCLQGDATPKLGGNLDVNGNCLKSASDGNIVLCPDGSGVVKISSNCFPGSDGSSGQLICTNGSGALQWVTVTGATPGGNNNEIQYNNSGSFGASSNLSYDGSTLAVTGAQTLSGNFTVGTKNLHVNTSTNKVGIGTTSPGDYDADDLVIQAQSGSQGGITIASDTNQAGRIYFADGTSGGSDARGTISYDHNNDKLSVGTAGSNRIYVHSDGHIALGGDTASVPGKVAVEGTSTTINDGRVLLTVFDDSNMASGVGGGVGFFGRHTNGSFTSFASVNAAKSNATDDNTDGDLVISTRQNSSDTLTEKMRIDSAGNVGIGTAAPDGTLHVQTASSGAGVTPSTSADDLVIENDGYTGLTILSPNDGYGQIYFGDVGANQQGRIQYSHGTDSLNFATAATERMRIDSAGNVGIGIVAPGGKLSIYDPTSADYTALRIYQGGDSNYYWDFTADVHAGDLIIGSNDASFDLILSPSYGKVGIGTAAPDGTLHVHTATAGSVTAHANADDLVIEGGAYVGMTFLANATANTQIAFGNSTDGNADGYIQYANDNNRMEFGVNGSERMRIDENGYVGIGTTTMSGVLNTNYTGGNHAHKLDASSGSFPAQVLQLNAHRAATSAYSFLGAYSGNTNDLEFLLRGDGNAYADGSWSGSGADYQEFFESLDGTEYEIGKAVVLDGDKVRVYDADTDSADNIMGITRPQADNKNSAVIGNTAWNHWTDKYLTDDWGVYLREDVTVWEWDKIEAVEASEGIDAVEGREKGSCYERDEAADWTPPEGATSSVQSVRKLNPEYSVEVDDPTNYSPRADRVEWNLIGLLGQVQIKANEPTNPRWIKMKDISDAVELWMIR